MAAVPSDERTTGEIKSRDDGDRYCDDGEKSWLMLTLSCNF